MLVVVFLLWTTTEASARTMVALMTREVREVDLVRLRRLRSVGLEAYLFPDVNPTAMGNPVGSERITSWMARSHKGNHTERSSDFMVASYLLGKTSSGPDLQNTIQLHGLLKKM